MPGGHQRGQPTSKRYLGDELVEVLIELDEEPRTVAEPTDLAEALKRNKGARAAFDSLPFGLKRKHVAAIEDAKSLETRQRRIAKLVSELQQGAA